MHAAGNVMKCSISVHVPALNALRSNAALICRCGAMRAYDFVVLSMRHVDVDDIRNAFLYVVMLQYCIVTYCSSCATQLRFCVDAVYAIAAAVMDLRMQYGHATLRCNALLSFARHQYLYAQGLNGTLIMRCNAYACRL
jgi:hypothetical protein